MKGVLSIPEDKFGSAGFSPVVFVFCKRTEKSLKKSGREILESAQNYPVSLLNRQALAEMMERLKTAIRQMYYPNIA